MSPHSTPPALSCSSRTCCRGSNREASAPSDLLPGLVGVEHFHGAGDGGGVRAQVLLVDDALVIDDEGHHAGHAVLRGERDEREAPDHTAVSSIVVRAVARAWALAGEDAIEIAVVRHRRVTSPVALTSRPHDQRPERAQRLAGLRRPVQTVVLAGRARELLGVLPEPVGVSILGVVLTLGVDVGQAHLDGLKLVPSDAPVEDLFLARHGVEAPDGTVRNQRNREREVVLSDVEDDLAATAREAVRPVVLGGEPRPGIAVGHVVTGVDQRATFGPQDVELGFPVVRLEGIDERLHGRIGRLEGPLPGVGGMDDSREIRRQNESHKQREGCGPQADHETSAWSHRRPPPPRPPPPRAPPPPPRAPPPPAAPRWAPPDPMLWRLAWPRLLNCWTSLP